MDRRPLVAGLAARLALGCGAALEGFFLNSGYVRRTYLMGVWSGTEGRVKAITDVLLRGLRL